MADFWINKDGVLCKYHGPGGDVAIPEGVTSIGEGAFAGCSSLQSVRIPDGVTSIGERAFSECSSLKSVDIPEGVTSIEDYTFDGCSSLESVKIPESMTSIMGEAFLGCSSLKSVRIPEGVTSIWGRAFKDCSSLESVRIPDGVTRIGRWAFEGCSSLKEIVVHPRKCDSEGEIFFPCPDKNARLTVRTYPKLPLSIIKEPAIKQELALGYCMAPERYEEPWAGEYQRYVRSQNKKLLERAREIELSEAVQFLEQVGASVKCKNGKKLSPRAKVELLEKTVLEGGLDELRAVIEQEGPFEFMACALGCACAFGGMEKVEILLESGADFTYEISAGFKRKYSVMRKISTMYEQPRRYWQGMALGALCQERQEVFFPCLDDGSKAQLLQEEERTRIALYLLKRNIPGFDAEELLYYAVLWGSFMMADALVDAGVGIPQQKCESLACVVQVHDRIEWEDAIIHMKARDSAQVLTRLMDLMEKQGKKLVISKVMMERWMEEPQRFDGTLWRLLQERADISRVPEMPLLKEVVSQERMDLLDVCVQFGWLETPGRRDKLINCAMEQEKNHALAWLMDYKNRTADFAEEEEKREKKWMRQLLESPDSVSAMRRAWSWKKQEDGTLCLISYKGAEVDVTVPGKIGKNAVTALEGTFNARTYAADQAARKAITSVRLPETIRRIGKESFAGCSSLAGVEIPESVTSIGESAFAGCSSLAGVEIPESVTSIEERTFANCSSLKSVRIPEGVTNIEWGAFAGCSSLASVTIPDSVMSIRRYAFDDCSSLKSVRIPEGVTNIERSAFAGCSSLAGVEIPEGVTSIGESAFAGCSSLASVTIPDGVTNIVWSAFAGCSNLTIHASAGSYAEQYAGEEGIPFEKI